MTKVQHLQRELKTETEVLSAEKNRRLLKTMDTILCDELLQEIFHHLPPSSSSTVSLVSKRWLRLFRSSTTSLSLRFSSPHHPTTLSLSAFLSDHPYLYSLSLTTTTTTDDSSDHLLLCVASSCSSLRHLRFLAGPLSPFPLLSLSTSCNHLSSLTISLSRPLSFHWLTTFRSLKDLSIFFTGNSTEFNPAEFISTEFNPSSNEVVENLDVGLNLESLCLTGIKTGDFGLNWLYRNSKKLKILKLKSCESVGDNTSFSAFIKCLNGLQEVELRTCRTIVDGVLLKLAENCVSLSSLLVYDGVSKEGLLHFINQSRCNLRKLDLRLPLDLDNNHLMAMAENFRGLSSLRLQSCCLVTGEGLKTLGRAMNDRLEELALINCDVVERESGLLTTLGQCFKRLRKLDLSYNDMLLDKEFISMLISCTCLSELKLRGCNRLTNAAMVSMAKSCKQLQSVDILYFCGIGVEAVEWFLLNSPCLRRVEVDQSKLSDVARTWASNKLIEVVA